MHLRALVILFTSVGLHAHRAPGRCQSNLLEKNNLEAKEDITHKISIFCEQVRLTEKARYTAWCQAKGTFQFKYKNALSETAVSHAIMSRPQCDDIPPMCASFKLKKGTALTTFETSSANNGKLLASPDGKFIAKWIQPNECVNFVDHYWNLPKDTFVGLKILNIALVILTDHCSTGAYAIFRRMDAPPMAGTYEDGVFRKSYSAKFDLKGSTFNRKSKEADAEQKDLNFMKQFDTGVLIPLADHVILTMQLLNASIWLGTRNFTDYSFMVYPMGNSEFYLPSSTTVPRVIVGRTAVAQNQAMLIGGILDNLEKYIDKKYEGKNKIQAVFKFKGIGKAISVAAAYQYACRFFLTLTTVMFLPDNVKVRRDDQELKEKIKDLQLTCHSLFTLVHKGGSLGKGQFINFMDMLYPYPKRP